MNVFITILRHGKSIALWNVLVFLCFCGAWQRETKFWTATAKLSVPQTTTTQEGGGLIDTESQGDRPTASLLVVNPLKTQTEILSSNNLLKKVWQRDPEFEKISDLNQYRKFFDINVADDSNVFSISAKGFTPKVVLQRAQLVTETYQQHLNELRSADFASRQAFYQADLKRASQDLSVAEYELARYRKAAGLVDTQTQAESIISLIADLKKIKELALLEANRDESESQTLASQLNFLPQGTITVANAEADINDTEDSQYQKVLQELTAVNTELKERRVQLTESHPYMKVLLADRDNLQQQLKQYAPEGIFDNEDGELTGVQGKKQSEITKQIALLKSSANAKRQQAQSIDLRVNLLEANLRSLPRQQSRLETLKRRLSVRKKAFNGLISQVERNRVDAFQSFPSVQLLATPTLNPIPISNRFWVAVYSLLAAGLGSLALLLILERRNPLLKPRDLAQTSFPIATRIPKLQPSSDSKNTTPLSLSGGEAAFLKMAYGLLIQEIPDRCLMVTSASSGEGKTLVALHLAKALEALGLKVLVLREQKVSDSNPTLPESLVVVDHPHRHQGSTRPSVDKLASESIQIEHFEFSNHANFETKVEAILDTKNYDFVILDAPPVQAGSSTTLMSMVVPNILLVVRPGQSTRFAVQDTLQVLSPDPLNLIGLVINDPGVLGLSNRKGWEENFAISQSKITPVKVAA